MLQICLVTSFIPFLIESSFCDTAVSHRNFIASLCCLRSSAVTKPTATSVIFFFSFLVLIGIGYYTVFRELNKIARPSNSFKSLMYWKPVLTCNKNLTPPLRLCREGDAGGGIEGGTGNQLDKVRACANKWVRTGALFSPEAALSFLARELPTAAL